MGKTFAGTSGKAFVAPDSTGTIQGMIGDPPHKAVPFSIGPGLEPLPDDPQSGEPGQYQIAIDGPVVTAEPDREPHASSGDQSEPAAGGGDGPHAQMMAWLQTNRGASPAEVEAQSRALGLSFWQIFQDGIGVMMAVETVSTDPRFKGPNSLGVQVTNQASQAQETVPVPGVTVTF